MCAGRVLSRNVCPRLRSRPSHHKTGRYPESMPRVVLWWSPRRTPEHILRQGFATGEIPATGCPRWRGWSRSRPRAPRRWGCGRSSCNNYSFKLATILQSILSRDSLAFRYIALLDSSSSGRLGNYLWL